MGLIGATALGLAAPAPAEEIPYDFSLSLIAFGGKPGDATEIYTSIENKGPHFAGRSLDLSVPDGVTITGMVDDEFVDGTERPDEGCALVTPQRVECHTNAVLEYAKGVDATFTAAIDDDVTGNLSPVVLTVTSDDGVEKSTETELPVMTGEPDLTAAIGPDFTASAPLGAAFDQTVKVYNNAFVPGFTLDFTPAPGVAVTGVTGLDLVDGTERPDEGCVIAATGRLECHTPSPEMGPFEITVHQRMPEHAEQSWLGDASVHVVGDRGGQASDAAAVYVAFDRRAMEVTATPSVTGAAGEIVEIVLTARNDGIFGPKGRIAALTVPAGATIASVEGLEILDEMTWVDDGCVLWTPQQVECIRGAALAPGDTEEWTFRVQLDTDAPAGELGVAALTYNAWGEDFEAETVVTVTGGSGDETGGDGEELPNTGTDSTTVAVAAFGLLLAGAAAMALRARRS
ncbi:LPXTG cell wall anchor domain-containing protein [Jiangella anatolica]|uniref:LPXTG cell wall anchor domain-containing protein n=1 Tax=Jiangella anatolica TaxID=2670374 RepID=UPI001314D7D5|nr:LPXTG cell wall anchor domain-containing protein [Jiangella anatolica]